LKLLLHGNRLGTITLIVQPTRPQNQRVKVAIQGPATLQTTTRLRTGRKTNKASGHGGKGPNPRGWWSEV